MTDQQRHDLLNGLLEMAENLTPFLDVAEGHRAEMERRGWSPTASETAALEIYLSMLRLALNAKPSAS